MIELTKLTNEKYFMNEELIEIIEQMPDTLITMKDGKKYFALESPKEIIDKIKTYKKSLSANGDIAYFKKRRNNLPQDEKRKIKNKNA